MSKIKLNVVRTPKDMIFDCVFLVLTVAIWGIIAWLISRAPDIVPTHFNGSGKPDAWGSPTFIIIPSLIMTAVALFCAFSIYLPIGSINMPFVEGPGNERQKKLGVLLSRIIGLLILIIMLFIAVYSLAMKNHDSMMPVVIILSVIFGVTIVFPVMIYRAT